MTGQLCPRRDDSDRFTGVFSWSSEPCSKDSNLEPAAGRRSGALLISSSHKLQKAGGGLSGGGGLGHLDGIQDALRSTESTTASWWHCPASFHSSSVFFPSAVHIRPLTWRHFFFLPIVRMRWTSLLSSRCRNMNGNSTLFSPYPPPLSNPKGLFTPHQNGKAHWHGASQLWPWRTTSLLAYIVPGSTSKSSCCVMYLTEVTVVIIWLLLALRLPLMIVLPFRPAAFRTPQELTSVKTRQSTTYKSRRGLPGLCCVQRRAALWHLSHCAVAETDVPLILLGAVFGVYK